MIRQIRQLIGHVQGKFQWEAAKDKDGNPTRVKSAVPIYRAQLVNTNKYIPGGANANVRGTVVRNPKVAEQINAMHAAWETSRRAKPASPV